MVDRERERERERATRLHDINVSNAPGRVPSPAKHGTQWPVNAKREKAHL